MKNTRSRLATLVTTLALAVTMVFSLGAPASALSVKVMGQYPTKAYCNGVRNATFADFKIVSQCFNEGGWFFTYDPTSARYPM